MERERPFCQEQSGGMNCWPISQAIPVDDKLSLPLFIWYRPRAVMECLLWNCSRIGRRWRAGQPRRGKRDSPTIVAPTIARAWMAFLPPWHSTTRNKINPGDKDDDRSKAQTRGFTFGANDWGMCAV